MVRGFLGFADAGESEAVGFQVDLGLRRVRCADGEGDVVFLGVGGG